MFITLDRIGIWGALSRGLKPMIPGCCALLGWTGVTVPLSSPNLSIVSSKSYTPVPGRSRLAKPCEGPGVGAAPAGG